MILAQVDTPAETIVDSARRILESLLDALPRLGIALVIVVLGLIASRTVRSVAKRYLDRSRTVSFSRVISKILGWVISTIAVLLAVTVVFPSVKPVDVLMSLGFVSIAIGFAFQDILENALAGLLLLFRESFQSGDQIEVVGFSGTVKQITIRETEIRTFDGRKVLIPNSDVYKNALVIQTAYDAIRSDFVVGVAYEADLDRARSLIESAVATVPGVHEKPKPQALLRELGTSTVNIEVRIWCNPLQRELMEITDRAIAAVKVAMDDAGIEMPSDIIALQATTSFAAALQGGKVTPGGNLAPEDAR